jgi:hypothetical protein
MQCILGIQLIGSDQLYPANGRSPHTTPANAPLIITGAAVSKKKMTTALYCRINQNATDTGEAKTNRVFTVELKRTGSGLLC